MSALSFSNETQAAVIIKAAPNVGEKHGETVCVACVDYEGNWHRLYPVPFKDLRADQRFGRWDTIRFRWRLPSDDDRPESKRIDPQTLQVTGSVPKRERHGFARRALVGSLADLDAMGKTFGLIRPLKPKFFIERRSEQAITKVQRRIDRHISQADFFSEPIIPSEAIPFEFGYKFEFDGRTRRHVCIDWETEYTFRKWRDKYGEKSALDRMKLRFGVEYPERGIAFAMGTHRVKIYRGWLLSAILRVDETDQSSLL